MPRFLDNLGRGRSSTAKSTIGMTPAPFVGGDSAIAMARTSNMTRHREPITATTTRSCRDMCLVMVSFSHWSSYRRRNLINSDEHSVNRELSIRYNQLLNMCDRFPLGSAICYTEGFRVRVVNPAFSEAVGVARERLRDRSLLDVVTAVDSAAVEQLTERCYIDSMVGSHWTCAGRPAATPILGISPSNWSTRRCSANGLCWSSFTSITLSRNDIRR